MSVSSAYDAESDIEVAGDCVGLCEGSSLVFFGEWELGAEVGIEVSVGVAVTVLVEVEEELVIRGAAGGASVLELSWRRSTMSCRMLVICMDVLAIPTAL